MFNKDTNPDEFDKIFAVYPGNPGRKPFWVTIIDTTMDTRPEHESFETWEKLFEGLNVLVNSAKIKSCSKTIWIGLESPCFYFGATVWLRPGVPG